MAVEPQLFVQELGATDAPTVVLLHGGGVSGWMWHAQESALQGSYHCLVPDLPEHGRSRAITPFTMADAARRVAQLIEQRASGGRAHVVGLSLGAQVVVELLNQRPELVEGAFISSALVRPLPGVGLFTWLTRMYMPFRNIDWLVRANLRAMHIPDSYLPQFREETCHINADALARVLRANAAYRVPPGLDQAQAPTLIVIGEKEYNVMHESARDLVKALPHASGYVASNHGHAWNFENPALFTATIRAWLNDQPLPVGLAKLE